MELRQLRYLIGVAEAGSLLAASRTLHVAQPALSQSIAALEDELGVTLFTRSNRGMALTPAGKTFTEHARIILADVERGRNAVRQVHQDVQGDVTVGLPTTVALAATLPILQATQAQYRKIRLKIVESHSGFLSEWLHEGRLDLSLLFISDNDFNFDYRPILEERLALVTAPTNTLSRHPLSLHDLDGVPLLLPSKEHGLRRIIDSACAKARVTLNVIAEVDSLPNIKRAVQAGIASTLLSPAAVSEEVNAGLLSMAAVDSTILTRKIACATSITRPPTPATTAMIELITEQIKELVDSGRWPAKWIGTRMEA